MPPPELLADLDFGLGLDIIRSGDSQSLTPFGSQQLRSSSPVGALGGLVLPSSSSTPAGSFRLHGDTEAVDPVVFLGDEDGTQLGEPDFAFDENGELVERSSVHDVAATPAAHSGVAMHSDAGASAKVRRDHEEGRMGAAQVSFTTVLHVFLYPALTWLSIDMGCMPLPRSSA
jgi:meiotic recombination protein REC8